MSGMFPLTDEQRAKYFRSWVQLYERASAVPEHQQALLSGWRGTLGNEVVNGIADEQEFLAQVNWRKQTQRADFGWPGPRAGWPPGRTGWPPGRTGWPPGRTGGAAAFKGREDVLTGSTIPLGFLPDVPDVRDLDTNSDRFEKLLKKLYEPVGKAKAIQGSSFLLGARKVNTDFPYFTLLPSGNFSPVRDQWPLGSCTAQATIGALEYLVKASNHGEMAFSPLFLYKVTRRLARIFGDSGASIREAIKAARLFGIPPEDEWPYLADKMDQEPEGFLYSYASNFKAIEYVRLDCSGTETDFENVLQNVKRSLLDGFPVVFGFSLYRSFDRTRAPHFVIPPPKDCEDKRLGGHAVVAVGYDDTIPVPKSALKNFTAEDEKGALIIRNSWGTEWGDNGYGCLPYYYVRTGLAIDFWSLFQSEWLNLGDFD